MFGAKHMCPDLMGRAQLQLFPDPRIGCGRSPAEFDREWDLPSRIPPVGLEVHLTFAGGLQKLVRCCLPAPLADGPNFRGVEVRRERGERNGVSPLDVYSLSDLMEGNQQLAD